MNSLQQNEDINTQLQTLRNQIEQLQSYAVILTPILENINDKIQSIEKQIAMINFDLVEQMATTIKSDTAISTLAMLTDAKVNNLTDKVIKMEEAIEALKAVKCN